MKYIVKEINIITNAIISIHEFDTADDALDYAWNMNEAMDATPIRYRFCG